MGYDTPDGWDPAGSGRAAQLLFVLIGLALLPIFLLTYPPETHKLTLSGTGPGGEGAARLHRVELDAAGTIRWEAMPVDLVALRVCLDRIGVIPGDGVDFRPDPDARYETFIEVLAVIRRSGLEHLRIDNRPFRRAIDKVGPAWWTTSPPEQLPPIPATSLIIQASPACDDVAGAIG